MRKDKANKTRCVRLARSSPEKHNLSTAHPNTRRVMGRTIGRRSQMEMIGLVIIVILITLGMLFMATFAFKKDPEKKSFTGEGLAYSTMGALMKTSVKCNGYDYQGNPLTTWLSLGNELIKDCAVYREIESSDYSCDDLNSCEFLEGVISELLTETLGKWNKHYEFHSNLLGYNDLTPLFEQEIKDENGCPRERDSSDPFPVSSEVGLIENILYICD
jgi:hypothetical protein